MQRLLRRNTDERGAAAVELALVVFPLLMLLLGIVEFGRVYSLQLRLQQAAREAAREIALHYDDPGMDLATLTADTNTTITALLSPQIVADLDTTSVVYCSTTSPPTPDNTVVILADQVELAIPLLGGSTIGSVGVAAKAQMSCEG